MYELDAGSKVALFLAVPEYGGKCECCSERQVEFLRLYQKIEGETWVIIGSSRRYGAESLRSLRKQEWPKLEALRLLCYNCGIIRLQGGVCPHEHARMLTEAVQGAT